MCVLLVRGKVTVSVSVFCYNIRDYTNMEKTWENKFVRKPLTLCQSYRAYQVFPCRDISDPY